MKKMGGHKRDVRAQGTGGQKGQEGIEREQRDG